MLKLKNKINYTLLSGFLLGIVFIIACNASGDGSVRAASQLSVYDADGDQIGSFVSYLGSESFVMQLSDGKLFATSNLNSNVNVYFAGAGCTGLPYIALGNAEMIVEGGASGGVFYYIASGETVQSVSVASNSTFDGNVWSCIDFAPASRSLFAATSYSGTVPSITWPVEIR